MLSEILDIFVKAGYEVTVHPTQCKDDAKDQVLATEGKYDLLVCAGGDGTLDEVVTGMMGCEIKTPIGYIPAGSTNDFAQSLHIPKSMTDAAQIAVTGKAFDCDIGLFNQDYFVYVAAFGLFSDVSYQTDQSLKHVFGHAAYLMEGMKRLKDVPSYYMRVRSEECTMSGEFVYGMITNSTSVGGMKMMVDDSVDLSDGLFEVTMIEMPYNPLQLQEVLGGLLLPKKIDSRYIHQFKTNRLVIESEDFVPWTLDGKYGGNHKMLSIRNISRSVRLIVDQDYPDDE